MAAAKSSSKIAQLFRKGWIEIPDVMVGSGVALAGVALGIFGLYKNSNRLVARPFKQDYIVKRDDDPEAEKYRKFHENPIY